MGTTRKELADRWNVTPQMVGKYRQAGMPMDSVEAAEEWRSKYTRVRHRKGKTRAKIVIDTDSEALGRPIIQDDGFVDRESAEANLKTLTATAQQCREAIAAALKDGDQEVARRWVTTLTNVMRANALTSRQLQEVLQADGVMLRRDMVEEVYIANLREMRALLESAIESLPSQLNPADPMHAREIFSDWFVNSYLRTMYNRCAAVQIPPDQWPQAASGDLEARTPAGAGEKRIAPEEGGE